MTRIAAVTGATGILGKRIVDLLVADGFRVRVLTRKHGYVAKDCVEIVYGDLSNLTSLEALVNGADLLFHCAAELNNTGAMEAVNVVGTRNLIAAAKKAKIQVFCHMSSVGVIGSTEGIWADETTECHPQNTYERTKYLAEQLVIENTFAEHTFILRPTNVVSEAKLGPLTYVIKNSYINRLKLFLKGKERAHMIHAKDVAAATIFCVKNLTKSKELLGSSVDSIAAPCIYILSLDHEANNSIGTVCKNYLKLKRQKSFFFGLNMPWKVPYYLRKLIGRPCNRGDLNYSSAKLLNTGFSFTLGLEGALKDISEHT
jgi:nucleoside-diphosphate-sugar epimerase